MPKTLNELADDLKDFLISMQSDVRDKKTFRPERYNNLKLEMNVAQDINPTLKISFGISEASYDIKTQEKISGSLGLEDKLVGRWFNKHNIINLLMACWNIRIKNRGKITDPE